MPGRHDLQTLPFCKFTRQEFVPSLCPVAGAACVVPSLASLPTRPCTGIARTLHVRDCESLRVTFVTVARPLPARVAEFSPWGLFEPFVASLGAVAINYASETVTDVVERLPAQVVRSDGL